MELALQLIYWLSLATVAYAYVGYPLVIAVLSRLCGRQAIPPEQAEPLPMVSLLISALNEEEVIAGRIENALASNYPADRLEIVIASDGSADQTAEIVADYEARYPGRVRLIDNRVRQGKATVLNTCLPTVRGEIVVLSDANTNFEPGAIAALVRWFQRPQVGVVCGKLKLVDPRSGRNVDSLYWRYETFLKTCEARLGALLGSNGAIYAIRRDDFVPVPSDTIIDDFLIPLLLKLRRGKQIVYDAEAVASEETPADVHDEFRRRARIGAGGYQSIVRLWPLLLPVYGWTSFAFWSHKVVRWAGPGLLAAILLANVLLAFFSPLYRYLLVGQLAFYLVALAGAFLPGKSLGIRVVRLATMFASMNVALGVGFWRWLVGRQRGTWQRTAR